MYENIYHLHQSQQNLEKRLTIASKKEVKLSKHASFDSYNPKSKI